MKFRTILIDPPWQVRPITGFTHPRNKRPKVLPYPTMTLDEIGQIPVGDFAEANSHLWLWTTQAFLRPALELVDHWGFKQMQCITWVKPSGLGAWWINRTQFLLFGYRGKLDMASKLHPNVLLANPVRHSQKPDCSYDLIEKVSHPDRLEIFARTARPGWHSVGNEIDGQDIRSLSLANSSVTV